MLQGQRDLRRSAADHVELAPLVNAQHGVFYVMTREEEPELSCSRATPTRPAQARTIRARFALGEGLVGQCALEKRRSC
jgi:hypothetical protein